MSKSSWASGMCGCGTVRFELLAPPMIVHCCHCSWCQRETGTAFATNALIELDNIRVLSGQMVEKNMSSQSGRGQLLKRCVSCETTLWSHYAYSSIGEHVAFVRVGTLDEPSAAQPDVHIYTASKQSWVMLPDGVPRFEEYYRAGEVWRQSALMRRQLLFDRAPSQ